jgi:hypothetical protein
VAVTRDVAIAKVVGQEDDHVRWLLDGRCRRDERGQGKEHE